MSNNAGAEWNGISLQFTIARYAHLHIMRLSMQATVAIALVFFASFGSVVHAATPYWRVTAGNVTVISEGSDRRCVKLAKQFLNFQRIVRDLADWDPDTKQLPLVVYSLSETDATHVFLTEKNKEEQRHKNMRIYSKYLPARDINIAAIVDSDNSDSALQGVLLLYSESMLQRGPSRVFPAWYVVGIPNLSNGVVIKDDGSALLNRGTPFEPIIDKDKRVHAKYDLPTLLATTGSDLASADVQEYIHRAREWAQFGLLTTPEHRKQYRELALLMRQGTPVAEAVSQAFGMPLEQLAADFASGKWRKQAEYKIPAPAMPLSVPAAVRIDADEANKELQKVSDRVEKQAAQ